MPEYRWEAYSQDLNDAIMGDFREPDEEPCNDWPTDYEGFYPDDGPEGAWHPCGGRGENIREWRRLLVSED